MGASICATNRPALRQTIRARALVNAAGPWVAEVAGSVHPRPTCRRPVRLVKGSHIVVPRLYDHDGCYIFQNADGRILFAIPYERDFTLIGTTDEDFTGDPTGVQASASEIAYLCRATSAYLRMPVTPEKVVWTFAGVRPLFDDGSAAAAGGDARLRAEARRPAARAGAAVGVRRQDHHLSPAGRIRAGHVAAASSAGVRPEGRDGRRRRACRAAISRWTGLRRNWRRPLPGIPFLPQPTLRRLLRAYGTRIADVLGDVAAREDLGRVFGADLTEAELRYLARAEWARTAEDVVWRRSKLGLRLSPEQIEAVDAAMRRIFAHHTQAA